LDIPESKLRDKLLMEQIFHSRSNSQNEIKALGNLINTARTQKKAALDIVWRGARFWEETPSGIYDRATGLSRTRNINHRFRRCNNCLCRKALFNAVGRLLRTMGAKAARFLGLTP
jgi:1,2-phenylacetyl-CoA epoxidase catalytic subunit